MGADPAAAFGPLIDLRDKGRLRAALTGLQVPGLEREYNYGESLIRSFQPIDSLYPGGLLTALATLAGMMFPPATDNMRYGQMVWFLPRIAGLIIGTQPGHEAMKARFIQDFEQSFAGISHVSCD